MARKKIKTAYASSTANINLVAVTRHTLPLITLSSVDFTDPVVYPNGAIMSNRSPDSPMPTSEHIPYLFVFIPLRNFPVDIDSNIFAFASSGYLYCFPWNLTPLAINAESNIDILIKVGTNNCLIIGNINCYQHSIHSDPVAISYFLSLGELLEWLALELNSICCLNANRGNR